MDGWPSGGLFFLYDAERHVTTTISIKSLTLEGTHSYYVSSGLKGLLAVTTWSFWDFSLMEYSRFCNLAWKNENKEYSRFKIFKKENKNLEHSWFCNFTWEKWNLRNQSIFSTKSQIIKLQNNLGQNMKKIFPPH